MRVRISTFECEGENTNIQFIVTIISNWQKTVIESHMAENVIRFSKNSYLNTEYSKMFSDTNESLRTQIHN